MERKLLFVLMGMLSLACSITINLTPPPEPLRPAETSMPIQPVTPTSGMQALPSATSTAESAVTPPSPTALPAPNVICNEIALHLPSLLGNSYACNTVPEQPEGMEVYPAHTLLKIGGYPLNNTFFDARIYVFPLSAYQALLPDVVGERVKGLQDLLTGETPPIYVFTGSLRSLPFLPTFNAGQVFWAQYQKVPFQNGNGIRYLTLYAQYFAPVNNHDIFYTYQGITQDGKYWISAILPITHPSLPANADNPPGGLSWDQFTSNYGPYITDVVAMLNSQPADAFFPSLNALDTLIASIQVSP